MTQPDDASRDREERLRQMLDAYTQGHMSATTLQSICVTGADATELPRPFGTRVPADAIRGVRTPDYLLPIEECPPGAPSIDAVLDWPVPQAGSALLPPGIVDVAQPSPVELASGPIALRSYQGRLFGRDPRINYHMVRAGFALLRGTAGASMPAPATGNTFPHTTGAVSPVQLAPSPTPVLDDLDSVVSGSPGFVSALQQQQLTSLPNYSLHDFSRNIFQGSSNPYVRENSWFQFCLELTERITHENFLRVLQATRPHTLDLAHVTASVVAGLACARFHAALPAAQLLELFCTVRRISREYEGGWLPDRNTPVDETNDQIFTIYRRAGCRHLSRFLLTAEEYRAAHVRWDVLVDGSWYQQAAQGFNRALSSAFRQSPASAANIGIDWGTGYYAQGQPAVPSSPHSSGTVDEERGVPELSRRKIVHERGELDENT